MKNFLFSLACLLCLHQQGMAQLELYLKGRSTSFRGSFADAYSGLGLEAGLTIQSEKNILAGGIHYNRNWLGSLPATAYSPELEVYMNAFNVHYGGKTSIGKYVHPFGYAVLGMRSLRFSDAGLGESYDSFFTSLTPTFGVRTGLQVGGKKWRVEGSLDYLSGTNAKYLTHQSIETAEANGRPYKDFAPKSLMNNLSVGVGLVYVIHWPEWIKPLED